MGYDPAPEKANRYYATGIYGVMVVRNASAYAAAVNSGLDSASCPNNTTLTSGDLAVPYAAFFNAGKGVGSSVAGTSMVPGTNPAAASMATCTKTTIAASSGGSCLGSQASDEDMVFRAWAVGIISASAVTGPTASGLNIDYKKVIQNVVNGY